MLIFEHAITIFILIIIGVLGLTFLPDLLGELDTIQTIMGNISFDVLKSISH